MLLTCDMTVAKAVLDYFNRLLNTGDLRSMEDVMLEFDEFNALVDLDEIRLKSKSIKLKLKRKLVNGGIPTSFESNCGKNNKIFTCYFFVIFAIKTPVFCVR